MAGTISPCGPELVTGTDELAALLVDTVNGGSSVGFLAPLNRETAAAWWRKRAGAVEAAPISWARHRSSAPGANRTRVAHRGHAVFDTVTALPQVGGAYGLRVAGDRLRTDRLRA